MNTRLLPWVTLIVAVALLCMTGLMILHIDPAPFVTLLGVLVVPLVGAVIWGKVDKVEQQTNGTQATLVQMVNGVLDHLKTHNSVPVPKIGTVTSTVEGTTTTTTVQKAGPDGGGESGS